jgi:hypothetical protein
MGVFKAPYGAPEHRQVLGAGPQSRGARESAPSGVCFFWLLLARAIPGAGPASALCAPNFAPGKIVFAQAKTNSTGSNLDRRRRPAGRGPGMVRVQSHLPWVSHPQVAFHHRRRRYKTTPLPSPLPQGERGHKEKPPKGRLCYLKPGFPLSRE